MHKICWKKIICITLSILMVWSVAFIIDFLRAIKFEKPIFVIPIHTVDDGGTGKYLGIGYWFDIKGNFLPEHENNGLISIKGYLFGQCIIDKKQ